MTNAVDGQAESNADRLAEMVANLLPRIRPLSGNLSEDELLAMAAYITAGQPVEGRARVEDASEGV